MDLSPERPDRLSVEEGCSVALPGGGDLPATTMLGASTPSQHFPTSQTLSLPVCSPGDVLGRTFTVEETGSAATSHLAQGTQGQD